MNAHAVYRDAEGKWHAAVHDPDCQEGFRSGPAYPSRTIAVIALALWTKRGGGKTPWPEWDDIAGVWKGEGFADLVADLCKIVEARS